MRAAGSLRGATVCIDRLSGKLVVHKFDPVSALLCVAFLMAGLLWKACWSLFSWIGESSDATDNKVNPHEASEGLLEVLPYP